MLEALTTEAILSLATVGVSGLAICGTIVALKATQRKQSRVDVDAIVKTAPYHRLHNVVQTNGV
ncbi:hypothetical protein ACG74X_20485 [Marivita sp. S0852]|jgi:hypothetical protein|uniref:hypothetical protein n=1 Tax=Marivita sp. S0852 TaxID=3373893 RepID=UPI003981A699